MRQIFLFLTVLSFLSCATLPKTTDRFEKPSALARVIFYNYSREDIYLRLMERGKPEVDIGSINMDEFGRLNRVDSLIPSGKSVEFNIPSGYYTIVPKKDAGGHQKADFNEYEEFRFPSSEEPYIIHLFPKHERTTTATITLGNAQENNRNSLFPSFDIYFSHDMIRPIVEESVKLISWDNKTIETEKHWHNNRRITIRPKQALESSVSYSVRLGLDARNTECERIITVTELDYTTGNEALSRFDPSSVKFDISVPGFIRLEWTLPSGANGSEILIPGKMPEDLYAKTNYTFSSDAIEQIRYKILPYRISANGIKTYNKMDQDSSYTGIPFSFKYGVSYSVITNTVNVLEFRLNFKSITPVPPNFEVLIYDNLGGKPTVLNASNKYTFKTTSLPRTPDLEVVYTLSENNFNTYNYYITIKRPSAEQIHVIQEQERRIEEQRLKNDRASEQRRKWEEMFEDERRFWSVGVNVGSMYGVPTLLGVGGAIGIEVFCAKMDLGYALLCTFVFAVPLAGLGTFPLILGIETELFSPIISGNINTTLAPFPYSFFELGCDTLFVNPKGIMGKDYISFYPYVNFNVFFDLGSDGYENGGLFIGLGTGRMFTVQGTAERADFADLLHDKLALNVILGGKLGKNPHYFDIRAMAGFDFDKGIYYTMLCGYSFRYKH